jgi:hypothetical protein
MGQKPLPLFKEIYEHGVRTNSFKKANIPSKKICKKKLYPSKDWAKRFPSLASGLLSEKAINKEMRRTLEKMQQFESWCLQENLTIRQVYAAVKQWEKLFLHPKGEFYWFFKRLQLATQEGSFFFVHAGVDNLSAKMIRQLGVKGINKRFKKLLKSSQFKFYHGPLGNMTRTKYREHERHFTKKGALMMTNAGINAIVHGHRNLYHGQRIMLRQGIINFECDASLDRNTRKKEGMVRGSGAAVTIIHPQKLVLGISSDYPYIKVFQPKLTLKLCRQ